MKKTFTFICLLSILFSCSEWKYSKGVKWEQPKYNYGKSSASREKNEQINVSSRIENAEIKGDVISEKEIIEEIPLKIPSSEPQQVQTSQSAESVTILLREEDSLQVINQEMVDIALEAEKQGRKSRNLGITGMILFFTYIFAIVGLVLTVIGLIKGVKSLRARYNTPSGVKMAKTGIITSSIVLSLYLLALISIVIILILFL